MNFSCEKTLLNTALTTTSRATASKSTIGAMEGILIEASSSLQFTGYNLETGIRATIPAEITNTGSLVVPTRLFCEIIRKMPDDIVYFSNDGTKINIKCGMSEYNILGIDPQEFPELPKVEQKNAITLPQSTLKSMLSHTLFAISTSEARPVHTGSLFDVHHNQLTVVSVDGFRLALRKETVSKTDGDEDFSFIVPGSALTEVEKICSGDGDVTICQGDKHILFQMNDMILVSRRLEGDFLAYKNAIPRNNTIFIPCDAKKMLISLERVSLIMNDKLKSPLRCTFGDHIMTVTTQTGVGDAEDQCETEGNGENLEIGFNHKYILDAMRMVPTNHIRLELSSDVAPCVILPAEGEENFIFMVLPIRLK